MNREISRLHTGKSPGVSLEMTGFVVKDGLRITLPNLPNLVLRRQHPFISGAVTNRVLNLSLTRRASPTS
jgi:hypothetical protein